MNAACKYCDDGVGEIDEKERSKTGGFLVTFVCAACGKDWDVIF